MTTTTTVQPGRREGMTFDEFCSMYQLSRAERRKLVIYLATIRMHKTLLLLEEKEIMNAREHGDELADFVYAEIDMHTTEVDRQIMTSRVVRMLIDKGLCKPPKIEAAPTPTPMSDAQALAFEATTCPLGKHIGSEVGSVPLKYFCSLVDPNEWIDEVRRYLDNPRIQREINDT